jgi:hypothetical protein
MALFQEFVDTLVKWSSIIFSHWQCPSDGDFSLPRFVGPLILSLWVKHHARIRENMTHRNNHTATKNHIFTDSEVVRNHSKGHSSLEPPGTHPTPPQRTASTLSTNGHRVITNKPCAVNQCTPRGQRVNAAWTTRGYTLDPRVGNAQSTQGKHASCELSSNGPPVERARRA